MAKIHIVYNDGKPDRYVFYCPGCEMHHYFTTKDVGGGPWGFNGSLNNPTVEGSIKVQWGKENVCHSYITNGQIFFHNDCTTHKLAGKTVELIDE